MPKVIIVGAGIGGIATAAYLARAGWRVLVLEKNAQPGGRCGQLLYQGHRFDVGASMVMMREFYEEFYHDLGEKLEDNLDLITIDPLYRIHFASGKHLDLGSDLKKIRPQLESIERESFKAFARYLLEGRTNYDLAVKYIVRKNFYSLWEVVNPKNLAVLYKLKAYQKHFARVSHFFKNPNLRAAFTIQDMYMGESPFDFPAFFSLLLYGELMRGAWYPRGGMYAITNNLVKIAQKKGVKFKFNAPVKSLEIDKKKIKGVILDNGKRLEADLVVANADLPYVYRKLLPESRAARRFENKRYTCSGLVFYWGIDQKLNQFNHHNVFLVDQYKQSFTTIFKDKSLPLKSNIYINIPSRTDKTAAPLGQESVIAIVASGHLDRTKIQDWKSLKDRARADILARLAQIGLKNFKQHIKFEISFAPHNWQDTFNLTKGAMLSLANNPRQVAYFRPHNRHAKYRNLYFVGSNTHPGNGVPMALRGAKMVSERILKEQKV